MRVKLFFHGSDNFETADIDDARAFPPFVVVKEYRKGEPRAFMRLGDNLSDEYSAVESPEAVLCPITTRE